MAELRWVLLALGILVIGAVYLWSQGLVQRIWAPILARRQNRQDDSERVEPDIDAMDPVLAADPLPVADAHDDDDAVGGPADRIVTLRFIPRNRELACDQAILALRAAGLRHGPYGIFHKFAENSTKDALFSVANLTEPGSFDLAHAARTKIPGMSIFMILPGTGNPVERFDAMVATARELARELGGELRDDKGSSWSIQRERYVREEVIEYCHLHGKSPPDA